MDEMINSQTAKFLSPHHPGAEKRWNASHFCLPEFASTQIRAAYHRAWNQFGAFTGQKHPDRIEGEHIPAWRARLKMDGRSQSAAHRRLSPISSFSNFINTKYPQVRQDNPREQVKRHTPKPYGKATFLQRNHDRELLASIDWRNRVGKREYAMILSVLTTTARVGVIAAATAGDIRRRGKLAIPHCRNKGGDDLHLACGQILWRSSGQPDIR